jgi:hypothetical protein
VDEIVGRSDTIFSVIFRKPGLVLPDRVLFFGAAAARTNGALPAFGGAAACALRARYGNLQNIVTSFMPVLSQKHRNTEYILEKKDFIEKIFRNWLDNR